MSSHHRLARELDADEQPRVLIVYTTRYGSTRGVAERIAHTMHEDLRRVDLRRVERAGDLGAYEAVVIGSPVYNGSWRPEAVEFVRSNAGALSTMPVWLFSVGALGDEHRLVGRLMKKEPREIDELRGTAHPRDYRVFSGAIERARWSWAGRILFWALGGRFGDNRDWPEIDAWAAGISEALLASGPVQQTVSPR